MNNDRNYKIVIGFLVALLVVLNVVMPYIKNKQQESKAVATYELMTSMANKTAQEQDSLAKEFMASQNKSIAMSADASYDITLCSIWTQIYSDINSSPILKRYGSVAAWEAAVSNAFNRMTDYCNRDAVLIENIQ